MSTPAAHEYGPYTLYDLDALPEDGKHYELADGWLTELSPSPWHDHAADRLKDILRAAAKQAGADVYVASGSNDISTPAGIRKPDTFVVPKDVARSAISRSGSERTDRMQKVDEYARAGIPECWIVELDPDPKVTVLALNGSSYAKAAEGRAVINPLIHAEVPSATRLSRNGRNCCRPTATSASRCPTWRVSPPGRRS